MVLDHDPTTAKLCEEVFAKKDDYVLTSKCSSIREAMAKDDVFRLDLLITETKVNEQSGLRFVNGLLQQNPMAKVLVVSTDNDFELIKQAFKIGVHGYLTKPLTISRLDMAITTIENEGTALSNDVSKKIVSIFRERKYDMLSQRENQIIGFLSQGATYKDIAKRLFVTPSTVNFHLQNIYLKLNVNSKSEALRQLKTLRPMAS